MNLRKFESGARSGTWSNRQLDTFFIKVRKKGQMKTNKNLMYRKVYFKIYLSISIWPFYALL
jgi:hypothetical protein